MNLRISSQQNKSKRKKKKKKKITSSAPLWSTAMFPARQEFLEKVVFLLRTI